MGEGGGQVTMLNGVVRIGLMRWRQLVKDLKMRDSAKHISGGRSSNCLVLYLSLCPNNFSNRKQKSTTSITIMILVEALQQKYLD